MYNATGSYIEEFNQGLPGLYSFEIFMYRITTDRAGNEEDVLVNRHSAAGIQISTNFIREFSVTKLDDMGMNVRFVVFDNTVYLKGMKPLALLAFPNGEKNPITIRYQITGGSNNLLKRINFKISNYKSCIFEFDTNHMRQQLLT